MEQLIESHRDSTRDQRITYLSLIAHRHERDHPTTIGQRDLLAHVNNRRLLTDPSRATNLSIDALADQTVDVRDLDMIWLVVDHTERYRRLDCFDLGDHRNRI